MTTQVTTNGNGHPPAVTTTEPPRATARFISPNGVSWLVTCPAPTVAELLDRLDVIEARLLARHWTPAEDRPAPRGNAASSVQSDEPAPLCDRCGQPMIRRTTRDGSRSFWSCQTRFGQEWCKGKPRKEGQS